MTAAAFPWRRLSRGVMLVGIGGFLLATTTGALPVGFWIEALRYWPVLLIGLGVRLLFQRSRAPWAILLSPLLVLGTLAWVALSAPTAVWAGGGGEPVSLARPADSARTRIHGRFIFAEADLSSRALAGGSLLDGRYSGGDQRSPSVRIRGDEAVVEIGERDYSWTATAPGWWENRWDLGVADDLPIAADLEVAFTRGRFDLGSADVSGVTLRGAFSDLTLVLGAPDAPARITLRGAFNRLRILVPDQTPVSVDSNGAFSIVRGRRDARSKQGPGYQVRLDGAFNSVSVRSAPAETPRHAAAAPGCNSAPPPLRISSGRSITSTSGGTPSFSTTQLPVSSQIRNVGTSTLPPCGRGRAVSGPGWGLAR